MHRIRKLASSRGLSRAGTQQHGDMRRSSEKRLDNENPNVCCGFGKEKKFKSKTHNTEILQ